jgi:hypothetical protein
MDGLLNTSKFVTKYLQICKTLRVWGRRGTKTWTKAIKNGITDMRRSRYRTTLRGENMYHWRRTPLWSNKRMVLASRVVVVTFFMSQRMLLRVACMTRIQGLEIQKNWVCHILTSSATLPSRLRNIRKLCNKKKKQTAISRNIQKGPAIPVHGQWHYSC